MRSIKAKITKNQLLNMRKWLCGVGDSYGDKFDPFLLTPSEVVKKIDRYYGGGFSENDWHDPEIEVIE